MPIPDSTQMEASKVSGPRHNPLHVLGGRMILNLERNIPATYHRNSQDSAPSNEST